MDLAPIALQIANGAANYSLNRRQFVEIFIFRAVQVDTHRRRCCWSRKLSHDFKSVP